MKTPVATLLAIISLTCLAILPSAKAVNPPPDGGYAGGNTAEGQSALLSRTTGLYNTALGIYSLLSLTDGSFCTGVGAGTLLLNTANNNTATGAGALFNNTTGQANTANGTFALFSNTTGVVNTAIGDSALLSNTDGNFNTAIGELALFRNIGGSNNTAIGNAALANNDTGSSNIALGTNAGVNITNANNVICIGADGENVSNGCYIGRISGVTSSGGAAVFVNSAGKLGTTTSSRRFKDDIKPMGKASEALFALQPVTFRYRKEIDPQSIPQFGLVAEEVEKVNADLVARDAEGKVNTVRYEQINAMLLNEFLKEHSKVEKLESALETLNERLKEQEAKMAKVSAHFELGEPALQVVRRKP